MDIDGFLNDDSNLRASEAKWNMFRFQDHLLSWIATSADYFHRKQYPQAFEALTMVYTDVCGFFSEDEQEELKGLFEKTKNSNDGFMTYDNDYRLMPERMARKMPYEPPAEIYNNLIEFRKKLLTLMTKYKLTIPIVRKTSSGAGSQ